MNSLVIGSVDLENEALCDLPLKTQIHLIALGDHKVWVQTSKDGTGPRKLPHGKALSALSGCVDRYHRIQRDAVRKSGRYCSSPRIAIHRRSRRKVETVSIETQGVRVACVVVDRPQKNAVVENTRTEANHGLLTLRIRVPCERDTRAEIIVV